MEKVKTFSQCGRTPYPLQIAASLPWPDTNKEACDGSSIEYRIARCNDLRASKFLDGWSLMG